jgi:C4-type Zn-finger protein
MGAHVSDAPADTQIECPVCGKTGTVRGIKHHYTTNHNDGVSGGLIVQMLILEPALL